MEAKGATPPWDDPAAGGHSKEKWQTLTGHVRLRVRDETVELPAGHLIALAANTAHDVEALEDSVFLITLAWPSSRGEH